MMARVVALALAKYLDRAALAATTVSTAIGLPSFTPLALAACKAALVRSLIRRRSFSASAARRCGVSRLAKGWSQARRGIGISRPAAGVLGQRPAVSACRGPHAARFQLLRLRRLPFCPRLQGGDSGPAKTLH